MTVGIAINDKTRPVPYSILIPPLLDELVRAGIPSRKITFYIENGTHVPDYNLDYLNLPKPIRNLYKFSQHNSDDLENQVFLGNTSFNTHIDQSFLF